MRITCCGAQIHSVWDNPAATLEKAGRCIAEAAAAGASLVAFPEQFATGWDPRSASTLEEIPGSIVTTLREYAAAREIAVLGTFRERHPPLPRNTAIAIAPDGKILATYSKCHLFSPAGEDGCFSPGESLGIFEISGMRFGIAICYDLRFPSLFEAYADAGVDAVIVPAAWPKRRARHWELFLQARAVENQIYMIGVNTTGSTPVDKYSGRSMIVDPEGTVVHQIEDEEGLLCGVLDSDKVNLVRETMPFRKDRRPALYRSLCENGK
ncbi:MAG: carbon-nitrogen hydrolase family protein [Methanoregulaceae archaeon]|nr:carbon-nitrogen hydrolase family protein [Methanoregulaceae archaeon]